MEEKQDVFFSKCMLGTDDQEDENCQRSGNFHFVSVCFCPVETGCSSVVPQPSMMVNCKWLSPSFLLLTFLPCSTLCFAPWLMFESHLSAAFRSPAAASVLALSSHFFCWKRDKETKPTVERKWNQAIPLGLLLRAIDLSPSPFLSLPKWLIWNDLDLKTCCRSCPAYLPHWRSFGRGAVWNKRQRLDSAI